MPEANASSRLRLVGGPRRPAAFHEALAAEEGLRKAKGERTRVRLMASGCELLQTTNVDSLMISRVSSQAGVAKGAFYIYFDSRSAFLEELCREYVAYEMSTFPELDPDMDAYEMVRTIVAWYADVFRKNSGMIRCLVRMTDVEETFAELWNRRNREIADRIVSFLVSFLGIDAKDRGPLRELVLPEGGAENERGVINYYLSQPGMSEALFEPGAAFHYSDTAFVLLALLVERATGESYHANLRNRIIEPCGLGDTYLAYRDDPPLGPRRQPESDVHARGTAVLSSGGNLSFDWGGGGLVTTAGDLLRFLRALMDRKLYGSNRTLRDMTAWQQPPGLSPRRTDVGLGLFRTGYPAGELWGHSGAWGAKMDHDRAAGIHFAGTVNRTGAAADWHHPLIAAVAEHIR